MNYKILFIDEEKGQREEFEDYMDRFEDKAEAICIYPSNSLEKTIEEINDHHPDAIISDYKLNEIKENIKYNVPFNGSELMDAYLNEWPGFPCFVLTSFDDLAVNNSADVNIIYVKKNVFNEPEDVKVPFAERIFHQIEHYRKRIADAQAEINILIEKRRSGEASAAEEQKLIDLDTFIEHSLGKSTSVPKNMKELSNTSRLNDLINKVDELLSKVEDK